MVLRRMGRREARKMHAILNHTPKLFRPADAELLAAELDADAVEAGDDWRYNAKHCPKGKGYSLVVIFDEDGLEVGTF